MSYITSKHLVNQFRRKIAFNAEIHKFFKIQDHYIKDSSHI